MKKGKYTHHEKTIHPVLGWLEPGKVYELPEDWDFAKETLFTPMSAETPAQKPKKEVMPAM